MGSISDWAILAVIVVVLFFGAKKIPELARSLGLARREFDQGRKEEDKTT
ncbi:MAG: twin-arginine translocase TatA/TatE family subunit [Nitrososphaerota archaeon]|nr:twin-arginine translocase TatA/TatE family subunit [Nitrososphaerota archaeon]